MRIEDGKRPILMDGAMGTELERRGLKIEGRGWSAMALKNHSAIVQSVHEDYLRAGAKIHIVNSFALARHVLQPLGLVEHFELLNRQAVGLFDCAVATTGLDRRALWAAGSISTFFAGSDRSKLPDRNQLSKNCRMQAEILANAGVDLFALEMLFDLEISMTMLEAVKPFELPVILGFTCEWNESNSSDVVVTRSLDGTARPLDSLLSMVFKTCHYQELIPAIMHSDIDITYKALKILRQYFSGPVAVYPNSGRFNNLRMDFDSVCSPIEFVNASIDWMQSEVAILGGCCGIGPKHIAELNTRLSISD